MCIKTLWNVYFRKNIVPYLIKVLYLSPYFDHKQGFGRTKISTNKAQVISGWIVSCCAKQILVKRKKYWTRVLDLLPLSEIGKIIVLGFFFWFFFCFRNTCLLHGHSPTVWDKGYHIFTFFSVTFIFCLCMIFIKICLFVPFFSLFLISLQTISSCVHYTSKMDCKKLNNAHLHEL